eukprot:scaffold173516_cov27-Tisochrysis_lutea.AAC.10
MTGAATDSSAGDRLRGGSPPIDFTCIMRTVVYITLFASQGNGRGRRNSPSTIVDRLECDRRRPPRASFIEPQREMLEVG